MTNELQVIVEESGLEQNKVETLLSSFGQYFQDAKLIADQSRGILVTNEEQIDEMAKAREARLKLWKIRCQVENTRKELKEQSLREGKAIDGISNVIKALIFPVEEHLEKQEKFLEILEKSRKAERLANRIEALSQYVDDVTLYTLADMPDEAFAKLLNDCKKAFTDQKEAEKKAEEERIALEKADALEREKLRIENEKLRKEALEKEEKARIEREKQEKLLAVEREKQEAALQKEREAREKVEAEIKAKKEADEKAKREEEEKKRQEELTRLQAEKEARLAPDKEKMRVIYKNIQDIRKEIHITGFASDEAQDVALNVELDLQRILNKIEERMKNI